jgi:hypothetical protein
MSERNGDKSRFGRLRKQQIHRRIRYRAVREAALLRARERRTEQAAAGKAPRNAA